MKKSILAIALLVSLVTSLSSCVATQNRRGRHDHGRGGWHHGPYDSNYHNYHRN